MQKNIKLTKEQARELLAKDPSFRNTILSVFTDEELGITPNWPKSWEELKEVSGYYVSFASSIVKPTSRPYKVDSENKSIFSKEKYAKSALAYAQLSQIVESMNNGWEPDWLDNFEGKWTAYYDYTSKIFGVGRFTVMCGNLLYFKTKEMVDFSIKYHHELWKDFFMVQ